MLDFDGERVGQINGLSVLDLGDYAFGRPVRITATAGPGRGALLSIERETELSGQIHDKGFLTLSGYLRGRYGGERRIALGATLTFEQSYDHIDGDSAASAELYALLSELAGVPLQPGHRGDRVGQPARRGSGDRRRQREDRGLLPHAAR